MANTIVPVLRGVSFNGKSIETVGAAREFTREFLRRLDYDYSRCDEWLAVDALVDILDEVEGIA